LALEFYFLLEETLNLSDTSKFEKTDNEEDEMFPSSFTTGLSGSTGDLFGHLMKINVF